MAQSKARYAALLTRWLAGSYALLLAALILLRLTIGDRTEILFALNALLLYGFLPLPCVLVAGVALRRTDILAVAGLGVVAWSGFWGELFVPRASPAVAGHTRIVVLSYNALGFSRAPADTVSIVRDSRADLVALQELNPETAALIERELGTAYPYRWLDPRSGVTGGGILSKHPLTRATPETLPGSWVGTPMIATVDVSGTELTFVRFHASAGSMFLRRREEQARALAAFAESRRGPLIVAGDLNATDQNGAYAVITRHLRDSWREVGWGFGHTFPGEPTPELGGSRPTLLGVPVPMWLIRIDYIFHSDDLEAVDAQLAPYSGASDHRGVVATLALP
jgi:endonuclease/exonuclease/phosphatase (EEP) superfamily protein YafD